jgi:hypothetical protein
MDNFLAQLPSGNLWLAMQAITAVWAGFNLQRALRTGETRFRIVGRRDANPGVYWALVAFWLWLSVGAIAWTCLILIWRTKG